jgi:GalNAc-alpha-(1->4)-GalNAc-alpha-(1->3)-diNAcBac-PP-undecaprenol alpha-1,4-N-acetyl-D-galactosaminyltransferase
MRIVSVIHSLNGGGAERVMAKLVTLLSMRGHDVTLVTLDDGSSDRHQISGSVQRVFLNQMGHSRNKLVGLVATVRRINALRMVLKRLKPDVVLSFCDVTNVLTLLSSGYLKVPVVVGERSDPQSQTLATPWAQLRPRLYRHAARVIVLTEAAARPVASWCRQPPVVIPSAVDRRPSDLEPLVDRTGDFVGVGRLEHEKGFDLLIDAFARIAADDPQPRLTIYGEGSLRQSLEQRRDGLGLHDRVFLPGWKTPIWPVLPEGGVFVLPSRYEGFPSALLEAMASGMACIANDCPSGPAAIISDGIDGILVPTGDISHLAETMASIRGNRDLRKRLGDQARRSVERFGWEAMVDRYEKVLRDAAAG